VVSLCGVVSPRDRFDPEGVAQKKWRILCAAWFHHGIALIQKELHRKNGGFWALEAFFGGILRV